MIETNFRLKSTSLIKKIFVKLFLRGNSDYVSGYERRVNYCSLDLTRPTTIPTLWGQIVLTLKRVNHAAAKRLEFE